MQTLRLKLVSPLSISCNDFVFFLILLSSYFGPSQPPITTLLAMAGTTPETVNSDYKYTPLSGPRRIRVLRLKRTKLQHDPLVRELFEVTVNKPRPLYKAVSYTWLIDISAFDLLDINYTL